MLCDFCMPWLLLCWIKWLVVSEGKGSVSEEGRIIILGPWYGWAGSSSQKGKSKKGQGKPFPKEGTWHPNGRALAYPALLRDDSEGAAMDAHLYDLPDRPHSAHSTQRLLFLQVAAHTSGCSATLRLSLHSPAWKPILKPSRMPLNENCSNTSSGYSSNSCSHFSGVSEVTVHAMPSISQDLTLRADRWSFHTLFNFISIQHYWYIWHIIHLFSPTIPATGAGSFVPPYPACSHTRELGEAPHSCCSRACHHIGSLNFWQTTSCLPACQLLPPFMAATQLLLGTLPLPLCQPIWGFPAPPSWPLPIPARQVVNSTVTLSLLPGVVSLCRFSKAVIVCHLVWPVHFCSSNVISVHQQVFPSLWVLPACHQHKYIETPSLGAEVCYQLLGSHYLAVYCHRLPSDFSRREFTQVHIFPAVGPSQQSSLGKAGKPSPSDMCCSALPSWLPTPSVFTCSAGFVWVDPVLPRIQQPVPASASPPGWALLLQWDITLLDQHK